MNFTESNILGLLLEEFCSFSNEIEHGRKGLLGNTALS
jgi:hypothetical protein